ncbi:MAG: hypothetical protein IT372_30980 [Polyangiaceae bacterium]|nr:hypothetical protein [Polyangiaceae bacterium]
MSKPALELSALPFDGILAPQSAARPANATRSLFHLASGAFALALLRLLPSRPWLIAASAAFAGTAWTLETLRRYSPALNDRLMRIFRPIAHAHERHRVNSSTWYMTALVVLAAVAPRPAAEIGVIVLAIADPAAGFIGRRYGRIRLRARRSLEGTLAFFAAGALAALAQLTAFHSFAMSSMLAIGLAGAAAGALAELFSTRLDDNFTIPLASAAAAAAALQIVPPMI